MVPVPQSHPAEEAESYPLSPLQQGLLSHHRPGGAQGVDVEQVIGELPEPVDPGHFAAAWQELIDRHAVLRTGFRWENGAEPGQFVRPAGEVRLEFRLWEFDGEPAARRGLEAYLAVDRLRGFATLSPPLLRVALLRGGPERFWCVVTYHHLALDARSMTVLFREAFALHDARVQGRPAELSPVSPYRPYISWLQTLDLARAEGFWRAHLHGVSHPTALPLVQPDAADPAPGDAAAELAFRFGPAVTILLRSVARRHQVTPNTLVLAAWSVLLSRYAGEDEVVFGALRACRHIPVEGADTIVGLLVNTVPLRVATPPSTPLRQWLRDLRAQWLLLRDYEHTPLGKIQQWSGIAPGQRLFESILSYQEPPWDAPLAASGGRWRDRAFDTRAQPGTPLALEVLAGSTLTVKLLYDRARVADAAAARLIAHYRVVLEALTSDLCTTVGELPLLTRCEHRRILVDWNRTAQEYPRECCVHALVEEHAARAAERIAVTDPFTSLTYGELNARANRLAHHLSACGIGPDALVAVCLPRSVEMLVAWLGTLKAGGAFVPLDPAYPAERLAFQLADSGATVLITQSDLRPLLPPLSPGLAVVELPRGGDGLAAQPAGNPTQSGVATQLAYVMYTSGSTGQPKGVAVEHRALMNLVTWHQDRYGVTAEDRASQLASPAFDAAVWEVWPYLASGASVHVADDDTRLTPARLWQWLADHRISLSFMPTPLVESALSEPWPDGLALRALLTGGDCLRHRPPENFPCPLINHYGPTETTVVATCGVVAHARPGTPVPTIGAPIHNTQAFVLDRELRPVPVGVVGELCLGGDGLARGYWRRPELTAERFVAVRLQPVPQRVYRTGDLVRWTNDGELEFVGRLDQQVKVRGCRIEPGEIEATLQRHPSVRHCLVLAQPDPQGEVRLVAYVVVAPDTAPGIEAALFSLLRARLPAPMVPSAIVRLAAWPLTPNGKIDRRALPSPPSHPVDPPPNDAAPLTPVERTVAATWSEVLGTPVAGREDNFFSLGGHSLLAARVVARINAAQPGAISVRVLFDHPTLADFARNVTARLAEPTPAHLRPPRLVRHSAPPAPAPVPAGSPSPGHVPTTCLTS